MNQLVQTLHKGNKVIVRGHGKNSGTWDSYRGLEEIPVSEVYKKVQHGGDIPIQGLQKPAPEKPKNFRHQTSDVIRKSLPFEEQEIDEVSRKRRLEELFEEGRRKRMQIEAEKNASRKHHDFFTPAQKSPISPNRYEDVVVSPQQSPSPQPLKSVSLLEYKLKAQSFVPERFQIQAQARALFTFLAQNPRELSFKRGDILYLFYQVNNNWWWGERYGQVGIIPTNYLQFLPSAEAANVTTPHSVGQARAKFSFTRESAIELSLKKGEFVTLLRRVDENWLEGCVGDRQGIFPLSYVDVIREPATPPPSAMTLSMPGTPEMLSPISWKTPSPPPHPSPSVFASSTPGTCTYSYRQPNRFPYGSQSSEEHSFPEFSIFRQKRTLSPFTSSDELEITLDSPKSSEQITAGTVTDYETNFEQSLSANESINTSWSSVFDDGLMLQRHKAVCAHAPRSEDELELKVDDEVLVLEKCDDGWFVGTSTRTGHLGTFPGNYVQKCY